MEINKGVLVIAHGSRDKKWVDLIDQVVADVCAKFPIEVGFLELVVGRSIADGVWRLEKQGVTDILVIPLFMTMGSTHLNEIQYALGLIDTPAIPTAIRPMYPQAKITWSSPLEDHPMVVNILSERIKKLTEDPSEEILFLIAHGSEYSGFHQRWEELLRKVTMKLRHYFGFRAATYATLHPDNIVQRVGAICKQNRVLVLPLFLSEGYFTKTLVPSKLEGLSYVYDGKTILPDERISAWIEDSIEKWVD